ncbi:hypothetical protein GMA8713_04022 [Grimontia marina]|uniref:Leucine-rich repeat protein n=2 Tax=Grimontia marina TaxID=646534 RepID=A0A128FGR8_9GAMM|nr:hypothetical protein GMA8713_04022 [Grimontia marina]
MPNKSKISRCLIIQAILLTISFSFQSVHAMGKKKPHFVDTLKLHGYIDNYGNVRLNHSPLTELPEPFEVEGFLDMKGSKIKHLPDGLTVKSYVNASNSMLTKFPKIEVGGYINLTGSKVTALPTGFKVNGDLSLVDTPITVLPGRLNVKGNLYLGNTRIKTLPADLKVGGDLYIRGTQVQTVPETVRVEGKIYR